MPSGARCHPNSISGADDGLQGEEQKQLRRARARRLIVETNRRRRALEDKQKQRDLREQRLREQVLQLRRRRIQEATERFQKAHLQPRRSRRSIPTIEEALDEIKSNLNAAHRSGVCTSSAQPGPASAAVQHQHRLISGDAQPPDLTHEIWKNPDSPLMTDSLENPPSFFLFDRPRLHVTSPSSGSAPFLVRRSPQRKPEELHDKKWKSDPPPYLDKEADAGRSDALVLAIKAACGEREFQPDLDWKQQAGHHNRLQKAPSSSIPPPGKEAWMGSSLRPNIELSHSSCDNTASELTQETGAEPAPAEEAQKKDLNRLSSSKNEKPFYKRLLQQTLAADLVRCGGAGEGGRCPGTMATVATCDSRFMKGILKPQGGALGFCDSDDVAFAKQVALAIRDSMELTRARARQRDGPSSGRKKTLRWSDQGPADTQMPAQSHSSPWQDPRPASVPGASQHGRSLAAPDRLTKQAWADVGVQVNLPQESAVPWRERCGPATHRKGTVTRPQSAAAVAQMAQALGKMIAPRPPPPRTQDRTPYGSTSAALDPKQDHVTPTLSPDSESPAKVRPRSLHLERHASVSGGRSLRLDRTPTEDQISELWHSLRSALASQNAPLVHQSRVPGSERSRLPSAHGNSGPPRPSQQTGEAAEVPRARATTRLTHTEEGAAWTHQPPQLSTLSLEEERILLSLERLDQRLQRQRR
ncbi:uncharacterized protein LOC128766989 isoform X2 [Synchiropus splendidus]|uniref:uncharacterized protein LOC128766989 isoform X2 n=1 Tax=Synchiropus splendidus TaxID=270530 RepID=UPI00237D9BB4|nr:uncharacterized protein LOC128766989 isoform X2 [Synchiropus splendidus]